jgi:hypothetical protein
VSTEYARMMPRSAHNHEPLEHGGIRATRRTSRRTPCRCVGSSIGLSRLGPLMGRGDRVAIRAGRPGRLTATDSPRCSARAPVAQCACTRPLSGRDMFNAPIEIVPTDAVKPETDKAGGHLRTASVDYDAHFGSRAGRPTRHVGLTSAASSRGARTGLHAEAR